MRRNARLRLLSLLWSLPRYVASRPLFRHADRAGHRLAAAAGRRQRHPVAATATGDRRHAQGLRSATESARSASETGGDKPRCTARTGQHGARPDVRQRASCDGKPAGHPSRHAGAGDSAILGFRLQPGDRADSFGQLFQLLPGPHPIPDPWLPRRRRDRAGRAGLFAGRVGADAVRHHRPVVLRLDERGAGGRQLRVGRGGLHPDHVAARRHHV